MVKKNYGNCYRTSYQRYRYVLNSYYKRDYSIMIPNALDGQHILTTIRRGHDVDCYKSLHLDENKIF